MRHRGLKYYGREVPSHFKARCRPFRSLYRPDNRGLSEIECFVLHFVYPL